MARDLWPVIVRFELSENDRKAINGDLSDDDAHPATLEACKKWIEGVIADALEDARTYDAEDDDGADDDAE